MKRFLSYLGQSVFEAFTQKLIFTILAILLFVGMWRFGHHRAIVGAANIATFLACAYWLFALFAKSNDLINEVGKSLAMSLRFALVGMGGLCITLIIVHVRLNLLMSSFICVTAYILSVSAILHEMKNNVLSDSQNSEQDFESE